MTNRRLAEVSREDWERLGSKRIFFGHQSVGRNIMEGVRDLLAQHPEIGLRVVQADDPSTVAGPAFIEGKVGANRDPGSKTRAFVQAVNEGLGPGDIALHKYCYVDVGAGTDPDRLFDEYAAAMRQLAQAQAGVTVVHVTLPLTTCGTGVKELVKTAVGRPTEIALNLKRSRYNERMRAEYAGKEPLFDLARFEAIGADGSPSFVRYGSHRIDQLAPEWTYDNGHLNEAGRRYVAEQLLIMLAGLPVAPNSGAPVPADAPSAPAQLH